MITKIQRYIGLSGLGQAHQAKSKWMGEHWRWKPRYKHPFYTFARTIPCVLRVPIHGALIGIPRLRESTPRSLLTLKAHICRLNLQRSSDRSLINSAMTTWCGGSYSDTTKIEMSLSTVLCEACATRTSSTVSRLSEFLRCLPQFGTVRMYAGIERYMSIWESICRTWQKNSLMTSIESGWKKVGEQTGAKRWRWPSDFGTVTWLKKNGKCRRTVHGLLPRRKWPPRHRLELHYDPKKYIYFFILYFVVSFVFVWISCFVFLFVEKYRYVFIAVHFRPGVHVDVIELLCLFSWIVQFCIKKFHFSFCSLRFRIIPFDWLMSTVANCIISLNIINCIYLYSVI